MQRNCDDKKTFTDKFMFCVQIENLNIHAVAAQRSFLWIWCGNADGLERGRKVNEFSTEQIWSFLKN